MADLREDITQIREDVAYIKAKVEIIPDHEVRLRGLERWRWGLVGTSLTTALAVFGIHAGGAL